MLSSEWRLPGPSRFARALAADLQDGISAVVVLPVGVGSAGIQEAVRDSFSDVDVNRLSLRNLLSGRRPVVDALYESLGLRAPGSGERLDVSDFAGNPDLGRRLIWIDGKGASPTQATSWGVFLRQYVSAASEVEAHRRAVFATLCEGAHGSLMPDQDRLLTKRWWWGVVDPLDTEVFVAEVLGERDCHPAFVETVTEVAGFDLGVARMLSELWDGSLRNLGGLLRGYELEAVDGDHDWSPEPSSRSHPPVGSISAWSAGVVNAWGEHDPHRHPCHVNATEPDLLRHLIWRGQVRGLLPRIEIERQTLAEWVYQRRDWLTPSWAGRDVKSLEVGELIHIFKIPDFRRDRSKAALARWLRWSRNEIAHLKISTPPNSSTPERFCGSRPRGLVVFLCRRASSRCTTRSRHERNE